VARGRLRRRRCPGLGDEIEALLGRIELTPGRDRLWLTGDLVNRGPRSLDVLRLVQGLGDAAVTVLGNHDVHLLGVMLAGERVKARDTLGEVLAAPHGDALCAWLRRREPCTGRVHLRRAGEPPAEAHVPAAEVSKKPVAGNAKLDKK